MRPIRRARHLALLTLPALLGAASCGIPATGVVEAGGPASGIRPITAVYFVRAEELVAVPSVTTSPGNAGAALWLLLQGPHAQATPGVSSDLPALPTPAPAAESGTGNWDDLSGTGWAASQSRDTVTVEVPYSIRELSALAVGQLICTTGAAHRVGTPSADPVTVRLTDGYGGRRTGTDEACPRL